MAKTKTGSYESPSDTETITDPARMERLLRKLANRYALLTVTIPGHPEHYSSSIVDVDREHVLLDELLPSSGHQLLLTERALQVTGKLDGIDIQFTTTLEHADNRDNALTYHARLPERLDYRQRRLDHRAHVPLAQTLRVIFDSPKGTPIEGSLHDLSRGGAGMLFPGDEPSVETGLLHECALELPDDVWLYCTVELRYTKILPTGDRQLIGARFVGLTPAQARLAGQCVSELEREFIRKRTLD
jgi:c-di-GMP-binding flagellar brake protein YcgR